MKKYFQQSCEVGIFVSLLELCVLMSGRFKKLKSELGFEFNAKSLFSVPILY